MSNTKTLDNFIKQIDSIRVNISNGKPAFKKPLLLLLLISKFEQRSITNNIIRYSEIEEELSELILNYGGRTYKSNTKAYQPFQYLNSSQFWELHLANGESVSSRFDVSVKLLREENTYAILQPEIFQILSTSANARAQVAQFILQKWWTDTIQQELMEKLNLPIYSVRVLQRKRNNEFKELVLENYRYKCAMCGFEATFNKSVFGLDGAHIRWFSQHGPDSISNGLALCKIHHWAFDKGAISVDSTSHRIQVSSKFIGRDKRSIDFIEGLKNRELYAFKDVAPEQQYLDWHSQHIFLG